MFLCNDPWVGGGLHQNDVSLFAPLFHDGKLFAWTGAVCHQVDLGGVSPGSWSVAGRDVFWESTPIPPVKIIENGELRTDIEGHVSAAVTSAETDRARSARQARCQ